MLFASQQTENTACLFVLFVVYYKCTMIEGIRRYFPVILRVIVIMADSISIIIISVVLIMRIRQITTNTRYNNAKINLFKLACLVRIYNNRGRLVRRIDYLGRPHRGVLPHVHVYGYNELGFINY